MTRADNYRNSDLAPALILRKFLELIHAFPAQFPAIVTVSGITEWTELEIEKAVRKRQTAIDRYGVTYLKVLANWTTKRFKLFLPLLFWKMRLLAGFNETSRELPMFLYSLDPNSKLCFAGIKAHAISC